MSVFQVLRLLFAFLTIFFTLFWNQSNNRFASQTSELGMFSNYPQAKNFLNSATLWSILGFSSNLALYDIDICTDVHNTTHSFLKSYLIFKMMVST